MVSDRGDLQIQVSLTQELGLFITLQHCLSWLSAEVPQSFWHQGPVSWKTIFPWTRWGAGGDGFGMIQVHYIYCAFYFYYYYIVTYNAIIIQLTIMLTGGGAQAVTRAMGSSCKYRRSFARPPLTSCCAAWFLTGHGPLPVRGPGVGDPWLSVYAIQHICFMFHLVNALALILLFL